MDELNRPTGKWLLMRLSMPPYQSEHSIEYIDCSSIGTWKELKSDLHQEQIWVAERLGRFDKNGSDLIARSFFNAWEKHHTECNWKKQIVPKIPQSVYRRSFPDTALLLTEAFPAQQIRMRLHADNSKYRDELTQLAKDYGPEQVRVEGDWTQSALIYQRPASLDRSTIVILDTKRVVHGSTFRANSDRSMSESLIRYLIGPDALALTSKEKRQAPCVVIVLSESARDADDSDTLVRTIFEGADWTVEMLPIELITEEEIVAQHWAWIASRGTTAPILGESLADAWN